jgi:hypothetical protein
MLIDSIAAERILRALTEEAFENPSGAALR